MESEGFQTGGVHCNEVKVVAEILKDAEFLSVRANAALGWVNQGLPVWSLLIGFRPVGDGVVRNEVRDRKIHAQMLDLGQVSNECADG